MPSPIMPTNTIDIFPWDENFNTGIAKIDEQHRRLGQMLNLLASNIAYSANADALSQLFDEMADYAVYHFDTEEAIWHAHLGDDPAEVEHRAIHLSFISEVRRLKQLRASHTLSEVAEDALGFLVGWLASHILESDRYLAYVVFARTDGLSLEQAKHRAKEQMEGGAHRALTAIVLSVYSTLSTNTLRLMRELTEHHKAKDALHTARLDLQERETNFRTFFDTIEDFLFVVDASGTLVRVNHAFTQDLGYQEAELIGSSALVLHPEDRAEEAQKILAAMLAGKTSICHISPCARPAASWFLRFRHLFDFSPDPVWIIGRDACGVGNMERCARLVRR